MKTCIASLAVVTLTVIGFAFLPIVQAVSPPPDGGYPGFNTAEGDNALLNLSAGVANTAVGWYSLFSAGDANYNTGVGAGTLALTGIGADSNTAVGSAAMLLNTDGPENTAVGANALLFNEYGGENNAIGAFALYNNVGGVANNAFGVNALLQNTIGVANTAVGHAALQNNDSTGNGTGSYNTAVGSGALSENTDGDSNTAVGVGALSSNLTGFENQTMGFQAMFRNIGGRSNVAIGDSALHTNANGSFNTIVGSHAGFDVEGSENIYIGDSAGSGIVSESGTIRIGDSNLQTAAYIAGISGQTASGGVAVYVDADGKLGTATSSVRFKEEIMPMDKASEAVLALKPVTFRYNKKLDPKGIPQFGLVAEEVEKVSSDLVARDRDGRPYTVRYDAVNAMLLNEFLKEHRKVEELKSAMVQQRRDFEAAIVQQQNTTEALVARLNEQEVRIQKVSAQIEVGKSGSQMLVENQ
jgi:hypothetical protein